MPDVLSQPTVRPRRGRVAVVGARLSQRRPSLNVEIDTVQLDWSQNAACRVFDPDLFFSDDEKTQTAARTVCLDLCGVRTQCLEYAVERDLYGIWGGTDRAERRRARKPRP